MNQEIFIHGIILEKGTLQTSGAVFISAAFAFVQLFHQVNGGSVKCLLWRAVPGTIVNAIVPIGVVLFRMIQYALPYLRLHCIRN